MSLIANSTGMVAVRLVDVHEAEPTVLQVPIVAWRTSLESDPMPVLAWGSCYDVIHDPRTGQVFSSLGESWTSLEDAALDLAAVYKGGRDGS